MGCISKDLNKRSFSFSNHLGGNEPQREAAKLNTVTWRSPLKKLQSRSTERGEHHRQHPPATQPSQDRELDDKRSRATYATLPSDVSTDKRREEDKKNDQRKAQIAEVHIPQTTKAAQHTFHQDRLYDGLKSQGHQ
ncbi:hypothetical protein WA026_004236 [Henosepilachna vigintioctopunctata]|uniref:Uncharacterized protein n=1 Tax=Henosepilachna vigintioctopunctata TaxID=420089 RepID=A0AAW1V889_9CUCU